MHLHLLLSVPHVIKAHQLIGCKHEARQITATLRWHRRKCRPAMTAANGEDQAVLMGTGVHLAAAQDDSRPQAGSRFRRIAVFCGASDGSSPVYMEAAAALGKEMVRRNIGLVYGGGSVGLMGVIARTVRCQRAAFTLHDEVFEGLGQGSVIGVIPDALQPREVSGKAVGEVRVVSDMHTRKAMMAAEADAFVALPGGFGTLEETLEMITWQQLGFHQKPVGFLNIADSDGGSGFYDHLLKFFDTCVDAGFVRPRSRGIALSDTDPSALLDGMENYEAPPSIVSLASSGQLKDNMRG